MNRIISQTAQLKGKYRLAAKFLHYHKYEFNSIKHMARDMRLFHYELEISEEGHANMFQEILEDKVRLKEIQQAVEHDVNAYRNLGADGIQRLLSEHMTKEQIKSNLENQENGSYDDRCAIRAWYFQLHPKFTPAEVMVHHRTLVENIGKEWFDGLEQSKQNEVIAVGLMFYEYHDYDMRGKLNDMTKDVMGTLTARGYTNLYPQLCRKVVQTIHREHKKTVTEFVKLKENSGIAPLSHEYLKYMYDKVERMHVHDVDKCDISADCLIKHVFINNHLTYTLVQITEAVKNYFRDVITPQRERDEVYRNLMDLVFAVASDEVATACRDAADSDNPLFQTNIMNLLKNTQMSEECSAQFTQARKSVQEALSAAIVEAVNRLSSDRIISRETADVLIERSRAVALIACQQLERRYVLVGAPLRTPEAEPVIQPNPKDVRKDPFTVSKEKYLLCPKSPTKSTGTRTSPSKPHPPAEANPRRRLSGTMPPASSVPNPSGSGCVSHASYISPPKSTGIRTSPPKPQRRFSGTTAPAELGCASNISFNSPPKETETKKVGSSPWRRSGVITSKSTDSETSPRKATKRSFTSTDEEAIAHQPKKTKKTPSDDDSDDSD